MEQEYKQYERVLEDLKSGKRIEEEIVIDICNTVIDIICEESNVLELKAPLTICGDIHGQFYDLCKLFSVGGEVPETKYLFLGDLIDRGVQSIETIMYILTLKAMYPDRIYFIRGNHECRKITQNYGFYDECMQKYSSPVIWNSCCDVFDYMSLAAIVNDNVFCVHGGLSPMISTVDQIHSINRKQEVPYSGAMCDMLWSDPDDKPGWEESPRGAGYLFGSDIVSNFLVENNLQLIVRAHQLVMEGYRELFDNTVVSVWSAPNYCYRCGNLAAILELSEDLKRTYKVFSQSELNDNLSVY